MKPGSSQWYLMTWHEALGTNLKSGSSGRKYSEGSWTLELTAKRYGFSVFRVAQNLNPKT